MTRDVRRGDWAMVLSDNGLRVESSTPSPGVLVLAVGGALTPAAYWALTRCLADHLVSQPAVLLLDLTRVTAFDEGAAGFWWRPTDWPGAVGWPWSWWCPGTEWPSRSSSPTPSSSGVPGRR